MKGKNQRLRNLLIIAIFSICLVGCGKEEAATTQPEPQAEVTQEKVEEPAETVETTEEEVPEKEEVATTEETQEPAEETPAEPEATEGTDELAYITDYTSIDDYMKNLPQDTSSIVVYNEEEHYILNMQYDQYYQMKKGDRVMINLIPGNTTGFAFCDSLGNNLFTCDGYMEVVPEAYATWKKDEMMFFQTPTAEKEIICYITPPTE